MAWSSAQISSDDLAYAADDKPILSGLNAVAKASSGNRQWSTTGTIAGADRTDSDHPVQAAHDGLAIVDTRPDASLTTWYLQLPLDGTQPFDLIAIIGHNIASNSGTVAAEIADDSGFTTNLEEIASWTPSSPASGKDDKRLVSLELKHTGTTALRYSNVEHLRIKVTAASAFIPLFREIWFGKRYQLAHFPSIPWNPYDFRSKSSRMELNTGAIVDRTFYKGQQVISPTLRISDNTQRDRVRDWAEDSGWGTQSFMWFDKPNSDPQRCWLMKADNVGLSLPLQGFTEYVYSNTFAEQGGAFLVDEG